jgi:4,5-dihydroxyphthalate decarboxylase
VKLRLSLAVASNPRTWPILDGSVEPQGIDLVCNVLHPSELFWRQLRFADFDVSEMSLSSLMMVRASGDERWMGLPVFTTRRFFHTGILVRRDAAIERPADLRGRRVGVPEYQQTAALWTRGVLQHEFGVHPSEIEFWMERVPSHSHAGATGFEPPPDLTLRQIPPDKSLGSMMLSGELEAALYYIRDVNLVDRSREDLRGHPDIGPLFPDPRAEGVRFYEKTGLFPINHCMVIRRELAEAEPWIVLNLLKAFQEAAEVADARRAAHVEAHVETGLLSPKAAAALERPLFRHGVRANRAVLETAAAYSAEQGLTPRTMRLDELFAASTLEQ